MLALKRCRCSVPFTLAPSLLLGTGLLACLASLSLSADPDKQPAPAKSSPATTERLGGPDRYLTHLSTDKPIYRPGETIHVRGVVLHHATRRPLDKQAGAMALLEIFGPKGDRVASGRVAAADSVIGFSWEIPAGQSGGEYRLKTTWPWHGYAPAERTFDIRAYRPPRLRTQIEFLRDGYGPGDDVVATLEVTRAEGGVPADAPVTLIARIDGREVHRGSTVVSDEGRAVARFALPVSIDRGEGTLAFVVEDGGVVETATKTIPILLQTVDIEFYPEGGDLVAGLQNRVYFEARTPYGKPADLAGRVLDENQNEVATFQSEHEGRGRIEFTPQPGHKYVVAFTEPASVLTRYPLPEVKENGAILRTTRDVYPAGGLVALEAGTSDGKPFVVTLRQREQELARMALDDTASINTGAGDLIRLALDPKSDASGVLVATLWDGDGKPLAERLLYRAPARQVRVKITPDHQQHVPGGKVRLTVETTDQHGKPVATVVGLTVSDDSVHEMLERRDQPPRLPVQVLLENDVRELADAHVYLDPENDEAPRAVDLLLGTQGWRRFAFVDPSALLARHGDAARRALALRLVTQREVWKSRGLGHLRFEAALADGAVAPAAAAPGQWAIDHAAEAPQVVDAAPVPDEPADVSAAKPQPPAAPPVDKNVAAWQPVKSEAGRDIAPAREQDADRQQLAQAVDDFEEEADEKRLFLGDRRKRQVANDFVAVRVYAHAARPDRRAGERIDFTETLFWHAGLATDASGRATVEFDLSDAVTSFRVAADAFSADGALGEATGQIESVEPFYLEPKLPLEVTEGDRVLAPVGLVNGTTVPLGTAPLQVEGHPALTITAPADVTLGPSARVRRLVELAIGSHQGPAELTLGATAGPYSDRVTRHMTIVPRGFPIEAGGGGILSPGETVRFVHVIPADLVEGSLKSRIAVHPTPLAQMNDALARLIREPGGCFEQTSSTVYPLIMAQQYFKSHEGVDPAHIARSDEILGRGYQRLIGFESKSGGFEWFGGDPGHDALTAYGLMEFTDMAQVREVDSQMLARTRKWLLGQRDGKGGYERKTNTLHTWLAEPELAFPYNTWALVEAGLADELSTEIAWTRAAGERSENTYTMALAALVLSRAGEQEGANQLLDRLAGKQTDDGSMTGATTSVVGSRGEALKIETTALAVSAWLTNPRYTPHTEKGIQYLAEVCKGGRFGSTQSTVLALRAIVEYDAARAKPKAAGRLKLVVDGQAIAEPVAFTAETTGSIELADVAELLAPGEHTVEITMEEGSPMPYTVTADYHTLRPESSDACNVDLSVKLRDTKLEEGGVTEAQVVVVNTTGEKLPSPLAIVGVPGGLEVRHDQLKELVKAGRIAAYEVRGREVVLYWRALDVEERVELPLSLVAQIPGTYTGPASRAYQYYNDEHKQWIAGLQVEIEPKSGG